MGYYLFDHARSRAEEAVHDIASMDDGQLQSLLEHGTTTQRQIALRALIARQSESVLIRCVASEDPTAVRMAISGLWECWLNECGIVARAQMDAGIDAMNEGNLTGAAEVFGALIFEFPAWAEPINKQATVLYLQGLPEQSIALCRLVVEKKPDHFGAWNGMALCAIQIEDWTLALEAVRQSLRLQPQSGTNLQLLKLVETRLPQD